MLSVIPAMSSRVARFLPFSERYEDKTCFDKDNAFDVRKNFELSYFAFRASTRSAAFTIFSLSKPYFFNSCVGVPLSPNESFTPFQAEKDETAKELEQHCLQGLH